MQSIEDLTETVTNLRTQAANALTEGGEHSREYQNAATVLRSAERQLTFATDREKRNKALSELSPSEIVDRVMHLEDR
ncbi:MAG: hypothetical protein H0U16_10095 [Actinobacteria bacterium]|nr:hypothetical protein [Actinomycetota bacterium]